MDKYTKLLFEISDSIRREILNLIKNEPEHYTDKLELNPSHQFTRKIDRMAEEVTIGILKKSEFTTYLISEEIGEEIIGKGEPDIFIVLDPVDGTQNAVNRIPFFCTSIALGKYQENITTNTISVGVVEDIPNGTIFWAEKGKGAFEDNKRIKTTNKKDVKNGVISFYAYQTPNIGQAYNNLAKKIKQRTLGSMALEISYVASARLDACVDIRGGARVVDTAAAKLILEEAGGVFYGLNGKPLLEPLKNAGGFSFIAAPNEEMAKEILSSLKN